MGFSNKLHATRNVKSEFRWVSFKHDTDFQVQKWGWIEVCTENGVWALFPNFFSDLPRKLLYGRFFAEFLPILARTPHVKLSIWHEHRCRNERYVLLLAASRPLKGHTYGKTRRDQPLCVVRKSKFFFDCHADSSRIIKLYSWKQRLLRWIAFA